MFFLPLLLFRGASSVVKIARHKGTGESYAVKMITKAVSEKLRFRFVIEFSKILHSFRSIGADFLLLILVAIHTAFFANQFLLTKLAVCKSAGVESNAVVTAVAMSSRIKNCARRRHLRKEKWRVLFQQITACLLEQATFQRKNVHRRKSKDSRKFVEILSQRNKNLMIGEVDELVQTSCVLIVLQNYS